MRLSTTEKFQPQDANYVEANDLPTDKRLELFKVGKIVRFRDRQDEREGIVGGFSIQNSNVEQVLIQSKEGMPYQRYRVDEIEFLEELSLKVKVKDKKAKKSPKPVVKKKIVKKPAKDRKNEAGI